MIEGTRVHRLFPVLAVIFIVSTLILTGTLAGTANSSYRPSHQLAGGVANVKIIESPTASVWLRKTDYGSGQYMLDTPDATVHVSSVIGSPLLNYKIQITSLGYAKTSLTMLNPSSDGRHRLSIPPATFGAARVQNDTYRGELFIIIRANETRTLYHENVTVYVER